MIKHFAIQKSGDHRVWSQASLLNKSFLVILASLIIAASAHISIPLEPVPVTLQSFAVLALAMTGGWQLGLFATIAYLLEGISGLPVFAHLSTGFSYLFGPTGGYLLAFPLVAYLAGFFSQRGWGKHYLSSFVLAFLGLMIILFIGTIYLSVFVGFKAAFALGFHPFILAEFYKAVMLAAITPFFWKK